MRFPHRHPSAISLLTLAFSSLRRRAANSSSNRRWSGQSTLGLRTRVLSRIVTEILTQLLALTIGSLKKCMQFRLGFSPQNGDGSGPPSSLAISGPFRQPQAHATMHGSGVSEGRCWAKHRPVRNIRAD
jgi:hypothetical protein